MFDASVMKSNHESLMAFAKKKVKNMKVPRHIWPRSFVYGMNISVMKVLKYSFFVGLGLAILAYIISPYWVLYRIQQAYEHNQAGKISQYIDYDAVKVSLKPQLEQRFQHYMGGDALPPSLQKWQVKLSHTFSDYALDMVLNPQTMMLLMQGKTLSDLIQKQDLLGAKSVLGSAQQVWHEARSIQDTEKKGLHALSTVDERAQVPKAVEQARSRPQAHYTGWNRFEVIVPHEAEPNMQAEKSTRFIMQRRGLSWKIIAVQLP